MMHGTGMQNNYSTARQKVSLLKTRSIFKRIIVEVKIKEVSSPLIHCKKSIDFTVKYLASGCQGPVVQN